jgi:hypothetical protein
VVAAPVTWWSLPQQTPRSTEETQPPENAPVEENVPEEVPAENAPEEENVSSPEFWTPPAAPPPENVPENMVAFHFVSAFTYVEGSAPISNVELELPWPYIDERDEYGRPAVRAIGLDNWLVREDLLITLPWDGPMARVLWDAWRLDLVTEKSFDEIENLIIEYEKALETDNQQKIQELSFELDFHLENAVWSVNVPYPGLPLGDVGFASAKIYRGEKVVGSASAHFEPWAGTAIFQKVKVRAGIMNPGDTVAVEGVFLVHEEDADKVRLDDWIESGIWRTFKPEQENAPFISDYWDGPSIKPAAVSRLEKLENGKFSLVVQYEEAWEKFYEGGISHAGLIDGIITYGE